jgi:hypothetical protein
MALPSKIKKNIPLTSPKTLLGRRQELLEKINKDGTYLPKSLLHADLDRGFLDFVKDDLRTVVEGKLVPTVDILITTQNWAQFTETWNFQNIDKNAEPPFIATVRNPEVKFGSNPALMYNIPNRKQYFYAQVPTWDGQRAGMDIYKIPQPVPVDITFSVKIICNRMRELNEFNRIVLEKFSSRQAYANIKGHYIPIIMNEISDESVMDIEKRKYYIQTYGFTMLGFLIDENEFTVSPAVSRIFQVVEPDLKTKRTRVKKENIIPEDKLSTPITSVFSYSSTSIQESKTFEYNCNLNYINDINVGDYDVFINDLYYGNTIQSIQLNTNDVVKIIVNKVDAGSSAELTFNVVLQ